MFRPPPAALVAFLLVVVACSRTQPSQGQRPTPVPTPLHSSKPLASAKPATPPPPVAAPAATPRKTPAAVPTPTPAVRIPRLPPNAAPRILSVAVDKTTVGSGDRVSGTVLTSSNVASVEVRVGGYGMALNKVGVGRFNLNYQLGDLPFFVHGTYEMSIIARNARGDTAQETMPITVR